MLSTMSGSIIGGAITAVIGALCALGIEIWLPALQHSAKENRRVYVTHIEMGRSKGVSKN